MAKLPVDDTEKFQKWLLEEFEDNGETVMFAPGIGFYTTPGCGTPGDPHCLCSGGA